MCVGFFSFCVILVALNHFGGDIRDSVEWIRIDRSDEIFPRDKIMAIFMSYKTSLDGLHTDEHERITCRRLPLGESCAKL